MTTGEYVRRARVLVVDDDASIRGLLAEFLRPMGCQVEETADGRSALELLEQPGWDIVLLDVQMPGMTGFQVLERIRQRWPVEDLPVVMITGMHDVATRDEALRLRANEFLTKPIRHADVAARMGTLIALHWARMELKGRIEELWQARELQEMLINCVIHDIKGPLTSARGFVELALARDPEGPGAAQLKRSVLAIDRSVAMAADAIAVAKMEEERLAPRLADADLAAVARERVEALDGMAGPRGVTLAGPGGAQAVWARLDPGLMARVVDNLVTNAIKHTPAGGRVTVSVDDGPDGPRLAVTDTGEGIPAAWLGRIFDKFAQVDLRRHGLGTDTGLGLTFCKLAVEAQGGAIAVSSEPGRGSVFTVSCPRRRAPAPAGG